jgi:hypothetical protein
MEDMIRHEALRAPMTFLYPTESRFLSSTVSSTSSFATFFMASTISVELNIPKKKDQQDAEREEVEATKRYPQEKRAQTLTSAKGSAADLGFRLTSQGTQGQIFRNYDRRMTKSQGLGDVRAMIQMLGCMSESQNIKQ